MPEMITAPFSLRQFPGGKYSMKATSCHYRDNIGNPDNCEMNMTRTPDSADLIRKQPSRQLSGTGRGLLPESCLLSASAR